MNLNGAVFWCFLRQFEIDEPFVAGRRPRYEYVRNFLRGSFAQSNYFCLYGNIVLHFDLEHGLEEFHFGSI